MVALILFLIAVAVVVWRAVADYERALQTIGEVVEVAMIGGPMDGRTVLAEIGSEYRNYTPCAGGWIYHRYEIRPGGWGVYVGLEEHQWPPAAGVR